MKGGWLILVVVIVVAFAEDKKKNVGIAKRDVVDGETGTDEGIQVVDGETGKK